MTWGIPAFLTCSNVSWKDDFLLGEVLLFVFSIYISSSSSSSSSSFSSSFSSSSSSSSWWWCCGGCWMVGLYL